MPYVEINVLKGLSKEKKKELFKKITKAFEDIGIKAEWVQIKLNEVSKDNWAKAGKTIEEISKGNKQGK